MFAKDIVIAAINSSLSAEKEKRKYPVIRFWSGHNILHIVMVFSMLSGHIFLLEYVLIPTKNEEKKNILHLYELC